MTVKYFRFILIFGLCIGALIFSIYFADTFQGMKENATQEYSFIVEEDQWMNDSEYELTAENLNEYFDTYFSSLPLYTVTDHSGKCEERAARMDFASCFADREFTEVSEEEQQEVRAEYNAGKMGCTEFVNDFAWIQVYCLEEGTYFFIDRLIPYEEEMNVFFTSGDLRDRFHSAYEELLTHLVALKEDEFSRFE